MAKEYEEGVSDPGLRGLHRVYQDSQGHTK